MSGDGSNRDILLGKHTCQLVTPARALIVAKDRAVANTVSFTIGDNPSGMAGLPDDQWPTTACVRPKCRRVLGFRQGWQTGVLNAPASLRTRPGFPRVLHQCRLAATLVTERAQAAPEPDRARRRHELVAVADTLVKTSSPDNKNYGTPAGAESEPDNRHPSTILLQFDVTGSRRRLTAGALRLYVIIRARSAGRFPRPTTGRRRRSPDHATCVGAVAREHANELRMWVEIPSRHPRSRRTAHTAWR